MTEILVEQRSEEWFDIRQSLVLTASKFGDAIGVGQGKPYDYLAFLLSDDQAEDDSKNSNTQHGVDMEPIIDEAYQLLTGNTTVKSGLWLPSNKESLHGLIAASPDAKVCLKQNPSKVVGLAEYKAPIHGLYNERQNPKGVPRRYMAQVQAQMAVTGLPWCDFMAMCENTKDVLLKRIYFNVGYWRAVSGVVENFCRIKQEAQKRKGQNLDPLDFPKAHELRRQPVRSSLFPGESAITVETLLERDGTGRFRSTRQAWLSYDFLVGQC